MMGGRRKAITWNRVLIDVCTQRDYLEAGAIMQVVNRNELLANLRLLFGWANTTGVPVVSLIESHRSSEPINGFPLHCIDNTPGQWKPRFTLLEPRLLVETDNYLNLPADIRKNYRQLLFRKRTRDILSNPKADRFLTQLNTQEFIIVGVGIERAVKGLALGLLARHKTVTVVNDACGYWSTGDGDLALLQMVAKGVRSTTTEELIAPPEAPQPQAKRIRRRSLTKRHNPHHTTRSHKRRSKTT